MGPFPTKINIGKYLNFVQEFGRVSISITIPSNYKPLMLFCLETKIRSSTTEKITGLQGFFQVSDMPSCCSRDEMFSSRITPRDLPRAWVWLADQLQWRHLDEHHESQRLHLRLVPVFWHARRFPQQPLVSSAWNAYGAGRDQLRDAWCDHLPGHGRRGIQHELPRVHADHICPGLVAFSRRYRVVLDVQ